MSIRIDSKIVREYHRQGELYIDAAKRYATKSCSVAVEDMTGHYDQDSDMYIVEWDYDKQADRVIDEDVRDEFLDEISHVVKAEVDKVYLRGFAAGAEINNDNDRIEVAYELVKSTISMIFDNKPTIEDVGTAFTDYCNKLAKEQGDGDMAGRIAHGDPPSISESLL